MSLREELRDLIESWREDAEKCGEVAEENADRSHEFEYTQAVADVSQEHAMELEEVLARHQVRIDDAGRIIQEHYEEKA